MGGTDYSDLTAFDISVDLAPQVPQVLADTAPVHSLVAMVMGDVTGPSVLTRVHSSCFTSEVMGSLRKLWRREMTVRPPSYVPRWIDVEVQGEQGTRKALAFTANSESPATFTKNGSLLRVEPLPSWPEAVSLWALPSLTPAVASTV